MRDQASRLFLVLAALLMLLGIPERAIAQPECVTCTEDNEGNAQCVPKPKGAGYADCSLEKETDECELSSDAPDCGLILALDGRSLRQGPNPALSGRAHGADDQLPLVPQPEGAAGTFLAASRHACTGAIIERRYDPARIAQLRIGLRRVTI